MHRNTIGKKSPSDRESSGESLSGNIVESPVIITDRGQASRSTKGFPSGPKSEFGFPPYIQRLS